jgi:outer membrane autotransporter protein
MERDVVANTGDFSRFKSNFRDNVYSAGLKASYVWILPNDVRITPSFGADFSHVRMGAVNERHEGGTLAPARLQGDKSNYSNLALPLMVSVNKTFGSDFLAFRGARSLWTPEIRGGYVPVVGKKRADVNFNAPAIPAAVNTESAKFAGSYGTVGAGMKIKLADRYIFEVDYDYTFGKKYSNHSFTGMYGVSF